MGFDVAIIGAGPGGTALGALLARRGFSVVVLEAGPSVGGRARTLAGAEFSDYDDLASTYAAAGVEILSDKQELDSAIRAGLLNGYHFEYGEHGIAGSHLLRIGYLAKLCGTEIPVEPNVGAWWEQDGELFPIVRGEPFAWMDPADYEDVRKISRASMQLSDEEVDDLDDTPFSEWLDSQSASPAAKSLHAVMATLNTGPANPADISTGEHLRINRQIIKTGAHITWAGIGFPVPGYGAVSEAFAAALIEAGGELRLSSPVERIVVEGDSVVGVQTADGFVAADRVVSSIPVPAMGSVLEPNDAMRKDMDRYARFKGGAALTFYMGCRTPVVDDKAWYSTPLVAPAEDGYSGDLVGGWIASSNCVPGRAPEGKQLFESWCGLTYAESQDPKLVQHAMERNAELLFRAHPDLRDAVEWQLVTLAPRAYPVLPSPGQVRLSLVDTKPGWYDNLYLVGDTVRSWGCSIDRVMHAVLLCAEHITGTDFLSELPESMR